MRELDRVIGYEGIKQELYRIIDIIRDPAKYKSLGVSAPKGILLSGEPGIGKTLMAKSFIKEAGLKTFTIRKDRPDGAFVDLIRETFKEAEKAAPSIVLLDDLDKFANEDDYHRDAEEYVTVQACIDDVKESDVFVLGTCNNSRKLPDSLVRSGRFDKT
jgi:cell division protease FtsH